MYSCKLSNGSRIMADTAAILRAFGEETRLRILRLLAVHEVSVSELVNALQLPQPRISRHLAVLKQAGLVRDRRDGTWSYYRMPLKELDSFARSTWGTISADCDKRDFFTEDLARLNEIVARRESRTQEYFNTVASEWDRIRRNYIDDALAFHVVASLVRHKAVIADIGCGTGEMLIGMARAVAKVIGVDTSEKMLDVCRERVEKQGLKNVELRKGRAEKLPLRNEECDTAFTSMLLHHLSEPELGVREMARVVKPGGKAIISDISKHDYDWTREVMADIWLGFTEQQIRDWVGAAGLVGVKFTSAALPLPIQNEAASKLQAFVATATKPEA